MGALPFFKKLMWFGSRRAKRPCEKILFGINAFWAALPLQFRSMVFKSDIPQVSRMELYNAKTVI
jgi:hypothetical protein